MYSRKIKKKLCIETPSEYVKIMQAARNPPFIVVDISDVDFLDFESKLKNQKLPKESLKINSAFVIDYFPSGKVDLKEDYFSDAVSYQIKQSCTIFSNLKFFILFCSRSIEKHGFSVG